ncbi:hypothetical protein ACSBR2_007635 [Camellia fascicularis]
MAPLQPQSPALSPSPTQTLHHHFTHPNHPLIKIYTAAEYKCDGCNTLGIGTRHRCSAGCDFDLHDYCATSPSTLLSPLHPNHHLSLLHHPGGSNGRFCDLCGHLVNGLFYTCQTCSFDAHPLCTRLPLHVRHAFHPQHVLTLQPERPGHWCDLCRRGCSTWRYRCGACDVDVHVECVKGPSDVNGRTVTGQVLTTWVPPPPPPPPPATGYLNQPVNGGGGGVPPPPPLLTRYLNQPVYGGSGGGNNSGQVYAAVGKLAAKAVLNSMFGVPIPF